jgi:hypothetical protein
MKIAMYDLQGNLLDVFNTDTYLSLEKQLKIPQGSLNSCVSGRHLSCINRQFRLIPEKCKVINKIGDISNLTSDRIKPVHKYYLSKYICSYNSIREASEINRIDMSSISRCLNGKQSTADGYVFKYAN